MDGSIDGANRFLTMPAKVVRGLHQVRASGAQGVDGIVDVVVLLRCRGSSRVGWRRRCGLRMRSRRRGRRNHRERQRQYESKQSKCANDPMLHVSRSSWTAFNGLW